MFQTKRIGLGAFAFVIGLGFSSRGDDAAKNPVNYAKDIAPILNQRCVVCHRPGQIGPMSLLSYEEARPWAKSIKKAVSSRTMPPWGADPGYGKFSNDCRLSDHDLEVVSAWVDQGAPAGDLSQAPEKPKFDDDRFIFGKPDQIFQMEPYKVGDDVDDHYEHVIVQNTNAEDKWISAAEIRPGASKMVHHVLIFLVPKDKTVTSLFEDPTVFLNSTFLTGWGPGTNPVVYPAGYGKVLPATHNILFQIHYHKETGPGTGGTDQSALAFRYADQPIKNPTTTAWVMDPTIRIPAGDGNYQSVSTFKFVDDGRILGLVPHMHLRGKDFKFEAFYPDGSTETLLWVPKFDFNWQIAYTLAEPKAIPKGTVVKATAHWDNSPQNPNNPDPKADVYFGEATTDEMMIGFMEYTYDNRKNSQGKFGLPEGMNNLGGVFGGGLDNRQNAEAMNRFKERREKMRRERSAPQGQ
ncbi:alkyl hydroperoxide reductase [Candidatus Sumerlaeota bacterium]|nr:alkyl hydroperoxide reductase [Candidatus Sumerlaeota bacterium]